MQKRLVRRSILLLVVVILFASTYMLAREKKTIEKPKEIPAQTLRESRDTKIDQRVGSVTLSVGRETYTLPTDGKKTLYQILTEARGAHTLDFTSKEYSALGSYVTSIGALHEGDGKYLMYYVNDKEATEGISAYVPHVNDTIVWKLK